MKRTTVGLLAVVLVAVVLAVPVAAHDYDRDDSDYLFRYVAYLVHPVGIALEYGVTRPVHWLVSSQPDLQTAFGHDPRHAGNGFPVCNLCTPGPRAVQCPKCYRPLLKPPDEYWSPDEFPVLREQMRRVPPAMSAYGARVSSGAQKVAEGVSYCAQRCAESVSRGLKNVGRAIRSLRR